MYGDSTYERYVLSMLMQPDLTAEEYKRRVDFFYAWKEAREEMIRKFTRKWEKKFNDTCGDNSATPRVW